MAEKRHTHHFVNHYDGMVAFGFSREIDEKSLIYYLQKFADDELLTTLVPRLSDEEITVLCSTITSILKAHLSDEEYHRLFLKECED